MRRGENTSFGGSTLLLQTTAEQKSPRTSVQLLEVPGLHLNALDQQRGPRPAGQRREDRRNSSQSATIPDKDQKDDEDEVDDEDDDDDGGGGEENERKDEEEQQGRNPKWIKTIRVVLPHLALATVVIVYTLLGAAFFVSVEQANEKDEKTTIAENVRRLRDEYLERMWNLTNSRRRRRDESDGGQLVVLSEDQFREISIAQLEEVTQELLQAFEEGLTDESIQNGTTNVELTWTYPAAVLFSATIITTVGYGNLVPKTLIGRIFCIIYALFGIPLTLITIADIGKFVGSSITWAYERFVTAKDAFVAASVAFFRRLWRRRRRASRTRRNSNRATTTTAAANNNISNLISSKSRRKSGRDSTASTLCKHASSTSSRKNSEENGQNGGGTAAEAILKCEIGQMEEEDKISEENESERGNDDHEDEDEDDEDDEDEEGDEDDDMPVQPYFILLIVVGYTALSSSLFSYWEGWSYLDSFYYCLITITTVGFGDLVPSDQSFTAFILIFIFFGLILATMCIDMVGTHYISKIHYMGRKLQDAKSAFAFIGGKAVNLKTWAKELRKVQREYGITDEQMKRLMENPDEYVQLIEAARMRAFWGPFEPKDASKMHFIDQNVGTISEYNSTGRSQNTTTNMTPRFFANDCAHSKV